MRLSRHLTPGRRRRANAVWLLVGAVLLGGAMALGSLAGNTERVTRLWVVAAVAGNGTARVTEVIDYDFGRGLEDKHGIYRDVPGLSDIADVKATVDGRPVPAETEYLSEHETRIRIGDPDRTISGVHRYRIEYPLARVAPGHRLAWNAVGAGWAVALDDIRIQVTAPFALARPRCVSGGTGSRSSASCTVSAPEQGSLVAELPGLRAGQGATLYSADGGRVASRPAQTVPSAAIPRAAGRAHPPLLWMYGTAAALVAMALTAMLLRRAGRSPLHDEGGLEAAGPGATDGKRIRRVDLSRLAASRPRAAAPPEGLDAARAGVLFAGRVLPEHKVALLMHAHERGWLTISQRDAPVLSRKRSEEEASREADAMTRDALKAIFGNRDSLTLDHYDYYFGKAWEGLDTDLREWLETTSGLCDPAGPRRSRPARRAGVAATLTGLASALTGAVLSGHPEHLWRGWAVAGAVVAGAGLALAVRAWEVHTLTPHGARQWLRVAAFRKYLAHPDKPVGDTMSEEDVRRYTGWAVALGEADHWSAAAEASAQRPGHPAVHDHRHLHTSALAASLTSAAATSSTSPPSDSSSGSSSSGSVGGGSGGGGGGSW
ncbi:DUF2207 domain-containing protein [Streptomyces sp. NBC_00144]|uniref:DUF2207 family protein n=1 Tax=Streptomyces sp. NBC_00144 TaxID=2975665 RepID=UPI003253689D